MHFQGTRLGCIDIDDLGYSKVQLHPYTMGGLLKSYLPLQAFKLLPPEETNPFRSNLQIGKLFLPKKAASFMVVRDDLKKEGEEKRTLFSGIIVSYRLSRLRANTELFEATNTYTAQGSKLSPDLKNWLFFGQNRWGII